MIGTGELILILCIALLLFGGKRLPALAKSLGQGLKEFKNALHGIDDAVAKEEIVINPKEDEEKDK